MVSSSTSNPLAPLEAAFQRYLQDPDRLTGLDGIECRLVPSGIRLLARHSEPEVLPPTSLLRQIEAAFREIMAEVPLPGLLNSEEGLSVQLQLQTHSGETPYATHNFSWQMQEAAMLVFGAPAAEAAVAAPANESEESDESQSEGKASPEATALALRPADPEAAPHSDSLDSDSLDSDSLDSDSLDSDSLETEAAPTGSWLAATGRWLYRYGVYGLAGMILTGSGLFAYGLTRPCVVGSCDRIQQAETLSASAQARLGESPTPADVLAAQADLQTAVARLAAVPFWSRHHAAVEAAQRTHQQELNGLNRFIQAQQKATQAAQASQDPPHPVRHWVTVQQLWQQAITLLETVPPDSGIYALAQQKLSEYQANYETIGRRVESEETAQKHFNMAVKTGQFATQRSESADSLAGWRLAEREWQTAVQELALIPQGTEAYGEAQEYLWDYRRQLQRAQGRVRVEQIASREYARAQTAAQQAQSAANRNQWTLAVTHWQDALASARAVPSNTSLTATTEAQIPQYEASLEQARVRLRTAVALQQMRVTLAEICGNSATPCTIEATPARIRLTLNAQHARALEASITPPGSLDGAVTLTDEQLIDAIMTLGDKAQPPLEIYDATGQFIARYRSDLGGFVRDR